MTNSRNLARRSRAQEVVYDHVNKRRREACQHGYNFIHVVHLQSLEKGSWFAVVLVKTINQQIFTVSYDATVNGGELKVDTFTRQHVSRFY